MAGPADGEFTCQTAEEENNKLRKRIQIKLEDIDGAPKALCVLMGVRICCLLLCFDVPAI